MGTDITMLVEARAKDFGWYPMIHHPIWPDETRRTFGRTPVLARNYELFSILADVRNRSGRGIKQMRTIIDPTTGDEVEFEYDTDDGGHDPLIPISNPKGIPSDATALWKGWLEESENKIAYHDHSYLTLEELESGQWDQEVYREAVMSEEEYLAYLHDGTKPRIMARGMGGVGTLVVNEVEYAAGKRGESATGVSVRWKDGTVRDHTKTFQHIMRAMRAAVDGTDKTPADLRIMFSFDS